MAGKPQKLSEGQIQHAKRITRNQVLTWVLVGLALWTGFTGWSLRNIQIKVTRAMEASVMEQINEPRIHDIITNVVSTEADSLLRKEVNPTVSEFKSNVSSQVDGFRTFVADMQKSVNDAQTRIAAVDSQLSAETSEKARLAQFKATPPQVNAWIDDSGGLFVAIKNQIPIDCKWEATTAGNLIVGGIMLDWSRITPTAPNQVSKVTTYNLNEFKDGIVAVNINYRSAFWSETNAPNLYGSVDKKYRYQAGKLIAQQ
jgi:hypothetical protein